MVLISKLTMAGCLLGLAVARDDTTITTTPSSVAHVVPAYWPNVDIDEVHVSVVQVDATKTTYLATDDTCVTEMGCPSEITIIAGPSTGGFMVTGSGLYVCDVFFSFFW
jgi:hypothetical protein